MTVPAPVVKEDRITVANTTTATSSSSITNRLRPRRRNNNPSNSNYNDGSSTYRSNDYYDRDDRDEEENEDDKIFHKACSLGQFMVNPCLCLFNTSVRVVGTIRRVLLDVVQKLRRQRNKQEGGGEGKLLLLALMMLVVVITITIIIVLLRFLVIITTVIIGSSSIATSSASFLGRRPLNDDMVNTIPIRIASFDYDKDKIDIGGWTYVRRFFYPSAYTTATSTNRFRSTDAANKLVMMKIMQNQQPDFGGLDIIRIQQEVIKHHHNNKNGIENNSNNNDNNEVSVLVPFHDHRNRNRNRRLQHQQLPPVRIIRADEDDDEDDYDYDSIETREDEYHKCRVPEWSKRYYPNCNSIHEIHLEGNYANTNTATPKKADHDVVLDTFYINRGYYRDVWVVHQRIPVLEIDVKGVLKIVRWKHKVNADSFSATLSDAMVMERLTKSPRIVDAYGHCGLAVWVEAIPHEVQEVIIDPNGTSDGMAKFEEQEQRMAQTLSSLNSYTVEEKLELALSMAESLADLHGYSEGVIVHDDVQLCQWLETKDGKLKLGDFNRAEVMKYNNKKKQYCPYVNGGCYGNYRSPEEFAQTELDEGIDVYTFGNNIYALITGLWVFYDTNDDEVVQKKVIDGTRAYIDPRWKQRSYIESRLIDVMQKCWKPSKNRIDIFQVVHELRDIKEKNKN